jgi:purine-binding chemotaxis protein CheW
MPEPFRLNKRQAQAIVPVEAKGQYLAFSLGTETFAMDIRSIKEVIQYEELTEVPLMPSFMRGVINLRGSVVPVIDLSTRFGRTATEVAKRTCIVILELEQAKDLIVLGVMVDHVSEVLEIAPSEIEPAPTFGTDLRAEFIQGVGKVNDRFVILLDVHHVLSVDELSALASDASPSDVAS